MSSATLTRVVKPLEAPKSKANAGTLRVNRPGDSYELEADRAAAQVMSDATKKVGWSLSRVSTELPLQRECSCGGECEECRKDKRLQRAAMDVSGPATAPPIVHDVLSGPGRQMDQSTRSFMESRFGHDFSHVRIFNDGAAASSASAVSANAYTVGEKIVFNEGRYAPDSHSGRRLLAHELAHVVQQSSTQRRDSKAGSVQSPKLTRVGKTLQRQCSPVACPALTVPIPSFPPIPQQAEACLQEQYAATHPNSKPGISLGFNKGWMLLTGKDLAERQGLTCLKGGTTARAGPNFTAKSGVFASEPDIWDFANRTMYEITTAGQLKFKSGETGKLAAQINLANALTGVAECGGLMFAPGGWAPSPPCCLLPSGLYISVVNVSGVLIYTVLKEASKEVALATLLAMMAALAKKGGGAAGKQLATAGAGRAAGRLAPATAIASLVATAILLGSGKAKAEAGPGAEEPVVQLFEALAQSGTPVPPEIQKMIEDDPELKEKVDRAMTKGGDPTALQKELNDKILKIIADNPDQFSKEDLEKIVAMTSMAGKALPEGVMTTDKVRKMLDNANSKGNSDSSETSQGEGKKNVWERAKGSTPPSHEDKPTDDGKLNGAHVDAVKATDGDRAKYPKLSDESLRKVLGASGPIKSLFDAIVAHAGDGPKLTDAAINEFFQIVPPDLTPGQSSALIAKVTPSGQMTMAEVLATMKAAIDEVMRKKPDEGGASAESNALTVEPNRVSGVGAQTSNQLLEELAKLAKSSNFSGVLRGTLKLEWKPNERGTIVDGDTIDATAKHISHAGVKGVGRLTGKIIHHEGDRLTIQIISSTPIVADDRTVLVASALLVGTTHVFVLGSKK